MKIYTHETGMLAMKAERQAMLVSAGGILLQLGERAPANAILLADARPRTFKGGRGPDDPADTAVIAGGKIVAQYKDFSHALRCAKNLARASE